MKDYQTTETAGAIPLPDSVRLAMDDIAGTMREGLLAMAVTAGLGVMSALMEESVTAIAGPKGKHQPGRRAVRHGSEAGSVTLGGRRVPVRRPRVRAADWSGELPVPAYELFSGTDLLGAMAMERMLAKLSCRRYQAGLEPVGAEVTARARSTSKSAVSRRFVKATETALGELLARDLSGLDLVALMVDGVHFGDHLCVVALGIGIDGTKHPLAVVEGATENTTTVTDLLVGLRDRGLDVTRPILVVIDGAKALRSAVETVFDCPVVARCQLHKIRINRPSGVESSSYLLASCRRSPARWRSMRSATRSWRAASSVHPRSLASSRRALTSSSCSLSSWARSGSGTKLSHCSQMLAYAQAPATGSREQNPCARRVLSISAWSQSTLEGTERLGSAAMTNSERRPFALAMAVL